jgi:subfamily B ATP-binding cassette protein MsbA
MKTHFWKDYRRLLGFLRPHLGLFFIATLVTLVSAMFSWAQLGMILPVVDRLMAKSKISLNFPVPTFAQALIDKVNQLEPSALLQSVAIIAILIMALKGFFEFLQSYLMADLSQKILKNIRSTLYRKMQNLSLDFFSQSRVGSLVSNILNDTGIIYNSIGEGLKDLLYQPFLIVFCATTAFIIHWRLAIISLVVVPILIVPIIRVGKLLRKISSRAQEQLAQLTQAIVEAISGTRIVKAFCREDYEVERFDKLNDAYYKSMMKANRRMFALDPITEFIGIFAGIIIFAYAGNEVLRGRLTFGLFGLFLACLLSLLKPFKRLSRINSINQQALGAASRIFQILDTPIKVKDEAGARILPSSQEYHIAFKNICFKYEEKEDFVLKEINLEIKPGQVVALVGPSGAGKTTLSNLLPRLYDATQGAVEINGTDIRRFTVNSLRQQIGMVTQETFLFNDTVKANIAYGKLEASDEEIMRAAQAANAQQFILNLPQGYETVIGDRGFRLSGGEKQRLAIARAVLKNPPILILDEATSQLDTESEMLVQEALDRLMQGRTVLVIAHRLSTVRRADKIAVLENGKIKQIGTHQQLMEKEGLYKHLYQLQFRE